MKAFAGYKNEICCIHSAYVDKLAKHQNGVKSLLVRQYPPDRTVDAERLKQKTPRNVLCIFNYEYKKESNKWTLGWRGNRVCWRVEETLPTWRNAILFYNEWDLGCVSWLHNLMLIFMFYSYMQKYEYKHSHQWSQLSQPWVQEKSIR